MTLLQIDFPSHGPWGEDLTKMASDLAHHLNKTPGMVLEDLDREQPHWRLRRGLLVHG
jgi:hypothetical protein